MKRRNKRKSGRGCSEKTDGVSKPETTEELERDKRERKTKSDRFVQLQMGGKESTGQNASERIGCQWLF